MSNSINFKKNIISSTEMFPSTRTATNSIENNLDGQANNEQEFKKIGIYNTVGTICAVFEQKLKTIESSSEKTETHRESFVRIDSICDQKIQVISSRNKNSRDIGRLQNIKKKALQLSLRDQFEATEKLSDKTTVFKSKIPLVKQNSSEEDESTFDSEAVSSGFEGENSPAVQPPISPTSPTNSLQEKSPVMISLVEEQSLPLIVVEDQPPPLPLIVVDQPPPLPLIVVEDQSPPIEEQPPDIEEQPPDNTSTHDRMMQEWFDAFKRYAGNSTWNETYKEFEKNLDKLERDYQLFHGTNINTVLEMDALCQLIIKEEKGDDSLNGRIMRKLQDFLRYFGYEPKVEQIHQRCLKLIKKFNAVKKETKEISRLTQEVSRLTNQLDTTINYLKGRSQQINDLKKNIEKTEQDVQEIEQRLNALNNQEPEDEVSCEVSAVVDLRDRGLILKIKTLNDNLNDYINQLKKFEKSKALLLVKKGNQEKEVFFAENELKRFKKNQEKNITDSFVTVIVGLMHLKAKNKLKAKTQGQPQFWKFKYSDYLLIANPFSICVINTKDSLLKPYDQNGTVLQNAKIYKGTKYVPKEMKPGDMGEERLFLWEDYPFNSVIDINIETINGGIQIVESGFSRRKPIYQETAIRISTLKKTSNQPNADSLNNSQKLIEILPTDEEVSNSEDKPGASQSQIVPPISIRDADFSVDDHSVVVPPIPESVADLPVVSHTHIINPFIFDE